MEGPAFSTKAESQMHRSWGADLIGMTALPEAKLAREAEMAYALVALVTDYDCWRPHEVDSSQGQPGVSKQKLLEEIMGNLKVATANAMALLRATLTAFAENPPGPSAAHSALELAIWSDRKRITPAVVTKYGPLLARHFGK